jgi:uncharacterized membrane protein (UPF0127 family)
MKIGNKPFLVIGSFAILFALFSFANKLINNESTLLTPMSLGESTKQSITVGDTPVYVEIAADDASRIKGLSGQKSLKENEGMLFIFDSDTYAAFWMKDMKFAIDIIWIKDSKIVHISKAVQPPEPGTPADKLKKYTSPVTYNRVLEVNAHFSDRNSIEIGDKVTIPESITQK